MILYHGYFLFYNCQGDVGEGRVSLDRRGKRVSLPSLGVPAASASVRFSKVSRTCLNCASVIFRPLRR